MVNVRPVIILFFLPFRFNETSLYMSNDLFTMVLTRKGPCRKNPTFVGLGALRSVESGKIKDPFTTKTLVLTGQAMISNGGLGK